MVLYLVYMDDGVRGGWEMGGRVGKPFLLIAMIPIGASKQSCSSSGGNFCAAGIPRETATGNAIVFSWGPGKMGCCWSKQISNLTHVSL